MKPSTTAFLNDPEILIEVVDQSGEITTYTIQNGEELLESWIESELGEDCPVCEFEHIADIDRDLKNEYVDQFAVQHSELWKEVFEDGSIAA